MKIYILRRSTDAHIYLQIVCLCVQFEHELRKKSRKVALLRKKNKKRILFIMNIRCMYCDPCDASVLLGLGIFCLGEIGSLFYGREVRLLWLLLLLLR